VLAGPFQLALRVALGPRFRRFARALARPDAAQEAVRRRLLAICAGTKYGAAHGVTGAEDYRAFCARLPVSDYEDFRPWIERQVAGETDVLTREPAVVYEKTSGSSGAQKIIPYTSALLRTFNGCFVLWAYDLIARGPRFRTGRMFFSVSPAFQDERCTAGGTRISLEDDAEYLAPAMRRLFGSLFVTPPEIKSVRDPERYKRLLAAILLAEERLEIVSVWSPTYLLTLLDFAAVHRESILRDLEGGTLDVGTRRIRLAPVAEWRLRLLGRDPIPWEALWPDLKLLSCWTDAGSACFVDALRARFPSTRIQGKGLLATEAPVTIPLVDAPAPVPLVDEVFLEFETAAGAVLRLPELEDGKEYSVIVTQAGGLVRYRMHDRVRVEGRHGRTPCLRFLGRDNQVSDLVGEKLHEAFVRGALRCVFAGDGGAVAFLVPVRRQEGPSFYMCVTDHAAARDPACGRKLDEALRRAFHYRQARLLGQLGEVELRYCADARARYERLFLTRGLKWGEIKFSGLVTGTADDEVEAIRGDAGLE
jgi:hypothetical protein